MIHSRRKAIILTLLGILLCLIFIIMGFVISSGNSLIPAMDAGLALLVGHLRFPALTALMIWITNVGLITVPYVAAGTFILALCFREWSAAISLSLGYWAVTVFTDTAKNFFMRLRPSPWLIPVGGWSYPSGHATATTIVWVIAALVIYRIMRTYHEPKIRRWLAVIICLSVPFMVGLSRVYLNVHWLSDVLGGWLFSTGVAFVLIGATSLFMPCSKK